MIRNSFYYAVLALPGGLVVPGGGFALESECAWAIDFSNHCFFAIAGAYRCDGDFVDVALQREEWG